MSYIKKHILILSKWYPNKHDIQLGVFVKNLAHLLKEKYHISVISVHSDEALKENFKIVTDSTNGIFEQVIYYKKSKSVFSKIINYKRYKKAQITGYKNIKTKIDICHVHVPIRPALMALKLLKTENIPFVITEHWSGHLNGAFQSSFFLYKLIYNRILNKAAKVSCVSEFLKKEFLKNTGTKPLVTPNYIEFSKLINTKKENSKYINILTVNDYIDKTKNITGLLKAFKKAVLKNTNLHLTLIGGGPDEHLISFKIKELNFNPNQISVLGRQPHHKVIEQMYTCDFYVSNSNFETFGMTIAEALIAGKPVVSTLSGGPSEFLNNENSITIQTKDNLGLENAILKMGETYQSYNSKKISESIKNKYGKETIIRILSEFYNI